MSHRYILDEITGDTGVITGNDAYHLVKVMRISEGDVLILSGKGGYDYKGVVTSVLVDSVRFSLSCKEKNKADPTSQVTVYMALPKGDKLEFIAQKMCELGAVNFVPFVSENCVAQKSKKDENKRQRLEKISLEAAKQSGRATPMKVGATLTFKEMLKQLEGNEVNLFFYEKSVESFRDVLKDKPTKVGVIIGSEGGFSPMEVDMLLEMGIKSLTLGKRILRCETAAITATSLTLYELLEME